MGISDDSLPKWFWPLAGSILGLIALANFSGQADLVLGAQAYIAAFHSGAVFTHWRVGHHPVVGIAPGVFILFAFLVTALRANVLIATVGTLACVAAGLLLGSILVAKPLKASMIDDEAS